MSAYIVCCCVCVDPNKLAQKLLDRVCSNLNKTCVYATLNKQELFLIDYIEQIPLNQKYLVCIFQNLDRILEISL